VADIAFLKEMAKNLRIEIVKMLALAGSGHTGGSLSSADIVTALYFYKMKHDPKNPNWHARDRFVLSKGHAAPVLYAALAMSGYFDKSLLGTLRKINSPLQGHPCCKSLPGIEVSTGSLGQGLSVANGMALGLRLDGLPSASHYKLDNLCAIIDHNNLQIDGCCSEVMDVSPIDEKFKAFGWNVFNIDGHNMEEIVEALDEAEKIKGKPTMIVAKTIKGKGVSIFEGKVQYHGIAPTKEELEIALKELSNGKN
jgi:transketolase